MVITGIQKWYIYMYTELFLQLHNNTKREKTRDFEESSLSLETTLE